MKIVCFPHFYYLSEASRIVEIGKVLRRMGQDAVFFSHSGALERLVSDASFRRNMLRLKNLQDRVDGAANAAREIINYLEGRG